MVNWQPSSNSRRLATIGQQVTTSGHRRRRTLRAYQSDCTSPPGIGARLAGPSAAPETVAAYLATRGGTIGAGRHTKALSVATLAPARGHRPGAQGRRAGGSGEDRRSEGDLAGSAGRRGCPKGKAPAVTDTIRRMSRNFPEGIGSGIGHSCPGFAGPSGAQVGRS